MSAACIGAPSLPVDPDDLVDGAWGGTLHITSGAARPALDISAPLSMRTDRNAGAFNHLEGHGRLTMPHGSTEITFYDFKGVQNLSRPSSPYLRADSNTFQLTAHASSDFRLDGDRSTLNLLDKAYCGAIGENAIRMHICRCNTASYGMSCQEPYNVVVDLQRTPQRGAQDRLLGWGKYHAILFLWLAPVFILVIRKAYRPWGMFGTVVVLVAVAPLTLGITWLAALGSSIADPVMRRTRTRRASS